MRSAVGAQRKELIILFGDLGVSCQGSNLGSVLKGNGEKHILDVGESRCKSGGSSANGKNVM